MSLKYFLLSQGRTLKKKHTSARYTTHILKIKTTNLRHFPYIEFSEKFLFFNNHTDLAHSDYWNM